MKYYILNGVYGEGATLPAGATEVPRRPSKLHEFVNGEWLHEIRHKVPSDAFISTVFAPPADMLNPPTDYTWNRENLIRQVSPATGERLPKGGFLSGTKAEILQIADWMRSHKVDAGSSPMTFTALTANADGTYTGGIISQEEYNRASALLDQYGVK